MKGKICLEDLKVHCVVGAKAHEREVEQELSIDIEMTADFSECVHSDRVADTIDYERVGEVCKTLAKTRRYHLLETFAYEAIHAIMREFPVIHTKIRVRKKAALPLARCAVVELEKGRD